MTSPADSILSDLNKPQREAILATSGALLINAGPGSGKTLVLTRRIAHILNSADISPQRICAVTFTNKAANEMKTRITRLVGSDASQITMSTFHSLCARILRQHGEHIGVPPEYVIYDETDTKQSIKRILKDMLEQTPDPGMVDAAITSISTAKNLGLTSESADMDEDMREIYAAYEESLWRSDALDFDDLLLRTVLLFDNSPTIAESLAARYVHVMVDEFQDASSLQYRIAARLARIHGNFCVVGDPDQSIYGWRQSDIRNFLTFREEYPDRREIMLETNYRSTGAVIQTASDLMKNAVYPEGYGRKSLSGIKPQGEPVSFTFAEDEDDEAEDIMSVVRSLSDERRLNDIAVCYRTNSQSRALEAAANRADIPYRVVGGPKFYQRAEIKDVMSYLRLLANPHDDMSFLRIINTPRRGIGARSLSKVMEAAHMMGVSAYSVASDPTAINNAGLPNKASNSLAEFTETMEWLSDMMEEPESTLSGVSAQVIDQTGYRDYLSNVTDERAADRLENIDELLAQTQTITGDNARDSLGQFIERVSLESDDTDTEANDRLTLTTIHQTKGMEWPVVMIAGMNEGTLPHQRSLNDGDIEEERRLCYVGITRAMERLMLFRPLKRRMTGKERQLPSRFLKEMGIAVSRLNGRAPGPRGHNGQGR